MMTVIKQISVERAALLMAAGELDKLYYENTSNGDLHCAKESKLAIKKIQEKTWFEKSYDVVPSELRGRK